jgi:tetratricopeptide (TPR) repeat protein
MATAELREAVPVAEEPRVDPYTGKFKSVKSRLEQRDAAGAYALAGAWQASDPGDLLALTALGESAEAMGEASTAARAYGSIIDLFPSRADLRRFAGERLEHLSASAGLDLAIDTFDKARADRPDHPASHRLAAFARLRKGDYAGAFDVMLAGLARRYPEGRFPGVDRILREDLGLIAAAWMKAEPARSSDILASLRSAGGTIEDRPSLRFVLNWETDSNDVDFHIRDSRGGHAYYASRTLPSGGELYADVTTGYGPECFVIREPRAGRAGPYTLSAHYFSRGPMGYGMGKLEIVEHDGHGGLKFEERPFVVMQDHAFVDLGKAL